MAWGAGDFDAAAVDLGDVFDDGEAEAGAAHFPAAGAVDAVEAFEDSGEVFGGDAETVVGDFEEDVAVFGFGCGADFAVVAGVFDGVVDEVGDGALEVVYVADDGRQARGSGHGELLAFAGGGGGE